MLILIRGLPGAGKTTLASELFKGFKAVAADDFMVDKDGNYKFDPNLLHYAHSKCMATAKEYIEKGVDVVVHNTFTTEREMQPYFDMAAELGVPVATIIVENRHGSKSVHGVPEATIDKMRARFEIKL